MNYQTYYPDKGKVIFYSNGEVAIKGKLYHFFIAAGAKLALHEGKRQDCLKKKGICLDPLRRP